MITRRSLVEAGSNADGFSMVSSGASLRVIPAALTMAGSPGSDASALRSASSGAVAVGAGVARHAIAQRTKGRARLIDAQCSRPYRRLRPRARIALPSAARSSSAVEVRES